MACHDGLGEQASRRRIVHFEAAAIPIHPNGTTLTSRGSRVSVDQVRASIARGCWSVVKSQAIIRSGVISGRLAWLGFSITTRSVNDVLGRRKPMLTIIDGVHRLGMLLVPGAVIGVMVV